MGQSSVRWLIVFTVLAACRSHSSSKPQDPVQNFCSGSCTTVPPPTLCQDASCENAPAYGFQGSLRFGSEEAPRNVSVVDDSSLLFPAPGTFTDVGYLLVPLNVPDPVLTAESQPDSAWDCEFQTKIMKSSAQAKMYLVSASIKLARVAKQGTCSTHVAIDGKTHDFILRRPLTAKAIDVTYHHLSSNPRVTLPIQEKHEISFDLGISGRDRDFMGTPSFTAEIPGCEVRTSTSKKSSVIETITLNVDCQDGARERVMTLTPSLPSKADDVDLPSLTVAVTLRSMSCVNRQGNFYYALGAGRFQTLSYQNDYVCIGDVIKDEISTSGDYTILPLKEFNSGSPRLAIAIPRTYTVSMVEDSTGLQGFFRTPLFPTQIGPYQIINDKIILFGESLPFIGNRPLNYRYVGGEFQYCNGGCAINVYRYQLISFLIADQLDRIQSFFCGYYSKTETVFRPVMTLVTRNDYLGINYSQSATLELMADANKVINWKQSIKIDLNKCP